MLLREKQKHKSNYLEIDSLNHLLCHFIPPALLQPTLNGFFRVPFLLTELAQTVHERQTVQIERGVALGRFGIRKLRSWLLLLPLLCSCVFCKSLGLEQLVENVIRQIKPQVVMVELDAQRVGSFMERPKQVSPTSGLQSPSLF